VKPDADTLPTVPEDPPSAGPDRALDPPPLNPGRPPGWVPGCADGADVAEEGVVVEVAAEEVDVAAQPESPIAALR
jgi:hypothetical protein